MYDCQAKAISSAATGTAGSTSTSGQVIPTEKISGNVKREVRKHTPEGIAGYYRGNISLMPDYLNIGCR